jgi:hypothetical protein
MDPKNYGVPETSQDGLRAFVKFTGQQILIINNDAFDWTNGAVGHARGPWC